MEGMEPFVSQLDLLAGTLQPVGQIIQRHLSDMRRMYIDADALRRILDEEGDRLIYEVYVADVPEVEGHLPYCVTIIFPGQVGEEFHMTKGHFHVVRDRAEVYVGLGGEGYLLLQKDNATVRSLRLSPGTVAYVPPFWAHRSVNTGDAPLIFFAAWPGDAGHDYGPIEQRGFAKILVARDGQVVLAHNPYYK